MRFVFSARRHYKVLSGFVQALNQDHIALNGLHVDKQIRETSPQNLGRSRPTLTYYKGAWRQAPVNQS